MSARHKLLIVSLFSGSIKLELQQLDLFAYLA